MKEYSVDVRTVWDNGTVNQRNANDTRSYDVKFTPSKFDINATTIDYFENVFLYFLKK